MTYLVMRNPADAVLDDHGEEGVGFTAGKRRGSIEQPFRSGTLLEVWPVRRSLLIALLITLSLLLTALPGAAFEYGSPTPTGVIGLRQPPIGVWLGLGPGESIGSVEMTLDGQLVTPAWDSDSGMLLYTPPAPLPDGQHGVKITVQVNAASPEFVYRPVVQEFTFFVQGSAVRALPGAQAESMRAVVYLNQFRAAAGLAPVRWDEALDAAAASHAAYLVRNPDDVAQDAHGERLDGAGFTGKTPGERAAYWTWNGAGVAEVIHFEQTAEEAIDGWMESLYHRLPLINPGIAYAGYGVAGSHGDYAQVMDLGGAGHGTGVVLWPSHGATGVPIGWSGLEHPDPSRLHGGWEGPVGYTVTATIAGARSVRMDEMRLTGPDGQMVPSYRFTPENDELLTDSVALIPEAPLAPNSRYEAHFAGEVDGRPWSRTWSFTTDTDMRPLLNSRSASLSGLQLREMRVQGEQFTADMKVYLGGLPVHSLTIDSSSSIRFQPPEGYRPGGVDELLAVMPSGREERWHAFFDGTEGFLPGESAIAPFSPVPLFLDGVRQERDGLLHRDGLLLPATVLEQAGAEREVAAATGRVFWRHAGRTADAMPGSTRYWVDGVGYTAPLPARVEDGVLYVPEQLATRLLGDRILTLQDLGGHWAEDQVAQLVSRGIVSGFADATFRPDEQLTRGAFIKMLATAQKLRPVLGGTGGFADLDGHWVSTQGWIGAARAVGIVQPSDYPSGRFEPDRSISREEIAVLAVRALGLEREAQQVSLADGWVGDRLFADVTAWTRPGHVALAIERGIITGYLEAGAYTFRPDRQATRAEAAVIVLRLLGAGDM